MLTLFFTIIFIAEVIIALQVIAFINKADKAVIAFNEQVGVISPQIKASVLDARILVNKALLKVYNLAEIMGKQKHKVKQSVIKNILTTLLFFMLSSNGKQVLATIDLIFTAIKFIDKFKRYKTA